MGTPAFSDFLRYFMIDGDGVATLKPTGNAYLACISFRGPDWIGSSPDEINAYERAFARTLAGRNSDWCYHISVQRGTSVTYPKDGFWPSSTVYALDFARRERFQGDGEHLPTDHRLWISYYPQPKRRRFIAELTGNADLLLKDSRETFESNVQQILGQLGAITKDCHRLGLRRVEINNRAYVVDDLVSAIDAEISDKERLFVVDPEEPIFLDSVLAPTANEMLPYFRIDDRRMIVATLWGWPNAIGPTFSRAFANLPLKQRITTRIIPYLGNEAVTRLGNVSKQHLLASIGPGLFFNKAGDEEDATPKAWRQTVKVAQERAKNGVAYCSALTTIVVYARTDAEYDVAINALETAAEAAMCSLAIEPSNNRFEAYLASLPGEIDENPVRVGRMSIAAACKIAPITSVWHGAKTHPDSRYTIKDPLLMMTTPSREPHRLYLHEKQVGHTLFVGKTGRGKSVMYRALENGNLSRYPGASCLTFDIGFSAYKYAHAIRGQHLTADNLAGPMFAPLSGLDNPANFEAILDWNVTLCETWLNDEIGAQQYDDIERSLQAISELDPTLHRVSGVGKQVQNSDLRQIYHKLEGSFLDAAEDTLDFKNAAVRYWAMEIGRLGVTNTRWTVPFIEYIQRKLFASWVDEVLAPRMILVDEGARAFKIRRLEEFGERIDREGRKNMAQFIFASQGTQEIIDSSIAKVLIEQTASKIAASNPNVRSNKDIADNYRKIGFTTDHINVIAELGEYDLLITNENGSQVVALMPTPLELAIFGGASEEDVALVDAMRKQHGAAWLPAYLRSRKDLPNMDDYATGLEQLDGLVAMKEAS